MPFCQAGDDRLTVFAKQPGKKQRWWCRQCDAAGDAIGSLQSLNGWSFPTALIELCRMEGVPLPASERRPSS